MTNFSRYRLLALSAYLCFFMLPAPFPIRTEAADLHGQEGVAVEFKLLQEPGPEQDLEFTVVVRIDDGYYVYASEDYSFGLTIEQSRGLEPTLSLEKPASIEIADFSADDPEAVVPVFQGDIEIRATVASKLERDYQQWGVRGYFSYQACTDYFCFPPRRERFEFGDPGPVSAAGTGPVPASGWSGYSLFWGALAAFLAGVALSLTPCVYPMVGITVAVIGGNTADSRGRTLWLTFVYVLGLSLVYALTGTVVALLGNRAAEFFRSPYVLIAVGLIFILMALSLFDLFSVSMPTAILSRVQNVGSKGSTGGVMAMGAVSALVVGSCVSGPLISLITFVAATGSVVRGFIYFFALAWGMGLLLFVAGTASGVLPQAGAWMQRVKHILGVVLLWAAFYFTRPVIGELVYYAATFTFLAVALAVTGLPQFPDKYNYSGSKRGFLQLASLLLILILLVINIGLVRSLVDNPAAFKTGPELTVDLDAELAHGEVVMLEFWAPWCAVCRRIERTVLRDPEIAAILQEIRVVKVHFDYNQHLNRQFAVIGPPAFFFLRPDGTRIGSVLVSPEEIRQAIENRVWKP